MSSRRRKHYVVRFTSVDNGPSEAGLEVPQTLSPESDDVALSEALCILTPPSATPFPDAPSFPLAISSSVISPMTLSATLRIASGAPNLKGSNSMGDTVAKFSLPRLCVDHAYLFDSLSKSFPLSLSMHGFLAYDIYPSILVDDDIPFLGGFKHVCTENVEVIFSFASAALVSLIEGHLSPFDRSACPPFLKTTELVELDGNIEGNYVAYDDRVNDGTTGSAPCAHLPTNISSDSLLNKLFKMML